MIEFVLPPLPYDYAALEPWINTLTMRLHHDVLHRRCVERLNRIGEQLARLRTRGENPPAIQRLEAVATWRASEHRLQSLFWLMMGPDQGGFPYGELAEQIADDFGSFAELKSQFSSAALSLETGGWVVLVWQTENRRLSVATVGRRQPFPPTGPDPLLSLDIWPHAYALQYQHRRAEYAHNWWNTVKWPRVTQEFTMAAYGRQRPFPGRPKRSPRPEAPFAAPPGPRSVPRAAA